MAALHTNEASQLPGIVESWGQVGQMIIFRGRGSLLKSLAPTTTSLFTFFFFFWSCRAARHEGS